MHRRIPWPLLTVSGYENISRTMVLANGKVAAAGEFGCVFIAAERWLAGKPPFCGRPTAPGSPYCPRHRALCRAQPAAARP